MDPSFENGAGAGTEVSAADACLVLGCLPDTASKTPALAEEVSLLFKETRSPLLRYLRTFGLPAEDGEEIAQDTFLALFQHLRAGGGRANIRGWLFRVAHNLALKRRQVAARKVSLEESKALSGFDAEDPGPNPEVGAVEQQAVNRILSAWRALPEMDRRCLALRAEGLRYRDIAAVLDISLGGVAQSLARSVDRLTHVARRHR
ncbi:MAG: sigma-70 family RNA polymerase sigma factor [Bryobacteraceae bacterium]